MQSHLKMTTDVVRMYRESLMIDFVQDDDMGIFSGIILWLLQPGPQARNVILWGLVETTHPLAHGRSASTGGSWDQY